MEKNDPLNLAKKISSELSVDLSAELGKIKGKKEKPKEIGIKKTPGVKRKRGAEKDKFTSTRDEEREKLMQALTAAIEIGDEEEVERIHEEMKTGEELFEEAQAPEAEQKAKGAANLTTPEKRQKKIDEFFPREKIAEQESIRKMEEIEKERAEKAQEEIDKYFPKTKKEAKESDEKIREFFSKGAEEVERKGIPLSRQEELEKLKGELEQARKDYLEIDYKKKKAWKRMADFFGKFIKSDQGPENDEILHYKDIYLNKLFNYKNALLEDAKARGASNKELGDLVKLFGAEVNCNLADVRDQVKMENQEGKLLGFFTKHSKDIIGWYNKLPRYKKIAIGAAFGLTAAAGAGFGGAAAAGAIGAAVSARRIFMGAVTGTGVALGAEAFLRKRTEKRIESGAEAMAEQFEKYESLSLEEKLKLVDEKIKWAVGDVDKKIARHKKTKLAAASLGILAGTFIGSGIASELFGEGFKKTTGFAKQVAEYFGYHIEVPVPVGEVHAPEIPIAPEAPEVAPVELTIEKGSSLEGTLIDYIKDHQSEIYDHHPELKNFDPGQIAHRMYLDYLHENANPLNKSLDLVYPGAEIEIDPATLRISEFADTKGAIGRAIEQAAGNHEKWAGMKNLSLKELAGAAKNKIAGLSNEYGKFWGPEAEVKSGEKIKDWLARVVRLAAEKK